ncbi:MAG TPA: hypothetical protein VFH07_01670 [Chitinophagaceae bacterium]|nr:hypothetical protein [Chitinophagaceae bacterium]
MTSGENTIMLTLVCEGKEYRIQTNRNQYHTLMTLIADHLPIPGFGLCSGMGSCGTCLVKISEKYSPIERFELSCEVQISDALANTKITIAGNNY